MSQSTHPAPAATTPVIEIRDLHKAYGQLEVIKGVSLTAPRGHVISLIGSSGSGKSTLLRCCNLLEDSQKGDILFEDEAVRWQGSGAALILKELLPGRALSDLGLRRPAGQDREGRGHSDPVSLENLQSIDADYMFFGTLGGSSIEDPNAGGTTDIKGGEKALAEAEKVPGFTELNAYQNDRIILVDGSSWTSTGGPILMNSIIDDVLKALA